MNLNLITLENNQTYIILQELTINNNKYIYMVNTKNKKDFIIRKDINGELVGLDDEKELQYALQNYINKEKELLKNGHK